MSKSRTVKGANLATLILTNLLMAVALSGLSLGLAGTDQIAGNTSDVTTGGRTGGGNASAGLAQGAEMQGLTLSSGGALHTHNHALHARHSAASLGAADVGGDTSATSNRRRPHPPGFTEGYGNAKVLSFRYDQQFFCTDERFDDLDGPGHEGDGIIAAEDPDEFQHPAMGPPGSPVHRRSDASLTPRWLASDHRPNGRPIANVEPIWAIVPFFDSTRDADTVLEAVEPAPAETRPVDVQCPEPGPPYTQSKGQFSECTMHPSALHAEPVVESFGVPLGAPTGDIPLPNHSHIIDGDNFNPIWWQTIAVRVMDESVWPDFDGGCPANPEGGPPCLTSVASLRAAQARGQASPDTPSNVFLFFDSVPVDLP